jgi:hypothetical protein
MKSNPIYEIFPQSYYTNDYENEDDIRLIPNYSTSVVDNKKITTDSNDNTEFILTKMTPNTYYDIGVKQPNNASDYGTSLIPDTRIRNDPYNDKFSNFSNNNNNYENNNLITIQPIVLYFIIFICLLFAFNCYQTNKLMKKMMKHNLINTST